MLHENRIKVHKSDLYACSSKKYAAKLLSDYHNGFFFRFNYLRSVDHHFENHDRIFYQNKKTGDTFKNKPIDYSSAKYRKFIDAHPIRKKALKHLNRHLSKIQTPEYVTSKRRSDYFVNAKAHKKNRYFITADIKSFYPNSQFKYIKDFFLGISGLYMGHGESSDVGTALAKLCTVREHKHFKKRILPQGFPTSVSLSYWAYRDMFKEINELADSLDVIFTVYVDDLTFSHSSDTFNHNAFIEHVSKILNKYSHTLNKNKIKVIDTKLGNTFASVTGIRVKRHKLRASQKVHEKLIRTYRKFTQIQINDAESYIKAWRLYNRLTGLLTTINYIEPSKTRKKREIIKTYTKRYKSYFPTHVSIDKILQHKLDEELFQATIYDNQKNFLSKHQDKILPNRDN